MLQKWRQMMLKLHHLVAEHKTWLSTFTALWSGHEIPVRHYPCKNLKDSSFIKRYKAFLSIGLLCFFFIFFSLAVRPATKYTNKNKIIWCLWGWNDQNVTFMYVCFSTRYRFCGFHHYILLLPHKTLRGDGVETEGCLLCILLWRHLLSGILLDLPHTALPLGESGTNLQQVSLPVSFT